MFLEQIIEQKKEDLARHKKNLPLEKIKEMVIKTITERSFSSAIEPSNSISKAGFQIPKVIAEIKKASPSKGVIREDFNPREIASIYEVSGASAISVLTEERHFLGSLDYLRLVKDSTNKLPILRKDFIFDTYQIYESKYYGADAILLIASILSARQMNEFIEEAGQLGLECLIEVHNLEELEKVLKTKAKIIGINNRDLKTFKVDTMTTLELLSFIPEDCIKISESGIKSYKDMVLLGTSGVHAVLVGELLMGSKDIGLALRELIKF
ncbi:MAG: indole-3-glycerol phosphate synthase TrpC [bacterium]